MAKAFGEKRQPYTGTSPDAGQNPYMASTHYLQKPDANLATGPMTLPEWAKPMSLGARRDVITMTLDIGFGERQFSLKPVRCAQTSLGANNFDNTRFDIGWK